VTRTVPPRGGGEAADGNVSERNDGGDADLTVSIGVPPAKLKSEPSSGGMPPLQYLPKSNNGLMFSVQATRTLRG